MPTIRIPAPSQRFIHHLPKALLPFFVGEAVVGDISHRHWSLTGLYWLMFFVGMALMMATGYHAYRADECSSCSKKTRSKSLTASLVFISRYLGIPLVVIVGTYVIAVPLFYDGENPLKDPHINPGYLLSQTVIGVIVVAYWSAVRFDRARFPGVERPRPIRTFLENRGRAVMHNAHWVYAIVSVMFGASFFLPSKGVWSSLFLVNLALFTAAGWIVQQHGLTLCEPCVKDFRTDAVEYAAKNRWKFRIAHKSQWVFVGGVVLVVSSFFFPKRAGDSVLFGYYVVAALLALLTRFHASYQPWCPWCRGGGGGDSVTEETPDPANNQPVPA